MGLFSKKSQKMSTCDMSTSDTPQLHLEGHFFVLTVFRHHMTSTEQTHSNMETLCEIPYT